MIVVTAQQVAELRQIADRAKTDGHFDDGELLHTLLDAFEKQESGEGCIEDLRTKITNLEYDVEFAKSERDESQAKVEDLEEKVSNLKTELKDIADERDRYQTAFRKVYETAEDAARMAREI